MTELVQTRYQSFTDRRWFIRLLEIIPGFVTWMFLIGPIILSFIQPILVAYFIIAFDLYWLIKALRLSFFLIRGYDRLKRYSRIDWNARLLWLEDPGAYIKHNDVKLRDLTRRHPHVKRLLQLSKKGRLQRLQYLTLISELKLLKELERNQAALLNPKDLHQAVVVAAYNEGREVLEPTIQSLLESDYPAEQIILYLAYEERGGADIQAVAEDLIKQYGNKFAYAEAVQHPKNIPGEAIGKGGNITFAGRRLATYIEEQGIDPDHVIVTTLDADNIPDPGYFAYVSYAYASNPNRLHKSFQPVPMFFNNIWDAPAPMRVIATGSTFWMLMEMMRPHRLRNFSSHAQSLKALLATDFWSVTSFNEDGHQYWRSYFTFDGDHEVVPLYIPVYQDAVLGATYAKTFKAQYIQLRRWAYGVTDFPFVVRNSIRNKRVPLRSRLINIGRLFEGHLSWATAALTLTFVAFLPVYLNQHFRMQALAYQLPVIASRIQTIALIGLIITVSISYISLPPRPERYGRRRHFGMIIQWLLLPATGILFNSLAAIEAQTRLMMGWYLTKFDVTQKSRKQ